MKAMKAMKAIKPKKPNKSMKVKKAWKIPMAIILDDVEDALHDARQLLSWITTIREKLHAHC